MERCHPGNTESQRPAARAWSEATIDRMSLVDATQREPPTDQVVGVCDSDHTPHARKAKLGLGTIGRLAVLNWGGLVERHRPVLSKFEPARADATNGRLHAALLAARFVDRLRPAPCAVT